MKKYRQPAGFMAVLVLIFALGLGPGFVDTAIAASEDVAMFYNDLSQYGQWTEYENYGPVWRPNQVSEDWRPYTNGRWVPTDEGYVFESEEPWGWATYHYGNWMPTEGNGWVWVPGNTWYPSTVEWRASPENTPPEDSYIGWAPTPPPDYVPPPSYAAPQYAQGNPVVDALTAPFWIFAKAASFLLGLGEPYTPDYSYVNTGVLVPPAYVPVFYPQTIIVQNYVTPAYYPPGFLGARRFRYCAYNWGPPPAYIFRVTRFDQAVFNRAIHNNSVYITRIHNVVPPSAVINRYRYVRQVIPPALAQGRPLPRSVPVANIRMAQANLYKPNILPPPREVPRINAQFPRLQPVAVTPGQGIPGTALPPRATMPLTPQMERQIQSLPPQQRFVPAGIRTATPVSTPRVGPALGQQPSLQPSPGRMQPGPQTYKGATPSRPVRRGEFRPETPPSGPPAGTFTSPGAPKPGTASLPQGTRVVTPEQRRQLEQEHRRLPRGATSTPQPPQHRDQEHLRQQQLQQQQSQQQERQRQMQLQHQQRFQLERQRQIQVQQQRQQSERQRQMQTQQQQQRQQQIQQQQIRQQQIQPRPQPQPQPRIQPQPQPQPQQQRQERGPKEQKKTPHEQK